MINFFKGIIVGIAKIIPGVSGSVLAISLGIYNNCVNILNRFYKMTKSEIIYIFPIILGVLFGILGFSAIVQSVYQKYYLATMLLFTGFIIGDVHKDISVNLKKDLPFYILGIIIFLILPLFNIPSMSIENKILLYFVLGFIESFTMVIPGISGTAILISLDLYDIYLEFMVSIMNISFWKNNFDIFLVYTISLIVCGYFTIKLVATFSKLRCFGSLIRTLMIISIIIMIKKSFSVISSFNDFTLALFMLCLGLLISYLLKYLLSKKVKRI